MQDYLIKKDGFKFSQILEKGYVYENNPVVLNKSQKADGSIKIVYAQYNELEIGITFGNLDGDTIKQYNEKFTDGLYDDFDVVLTKSSEVA